MYATFTPNDIVGFAGFVVGLIGLAATVWTSWASRVGARLGYRWKAERVIGGDGELGEGIEVAFRGTPVSRLTRAVVVVWNSGTVTMRDRDIVQLDPLRVQCEENAEILSARVLQSSRQIVAADILIDPANPNRTLLTFDFFDPGDGVVIEVLHTGEEKKPSLCGTLRGMPKGIKDWGKLAIWVPGRPPIPPLEYPMTRKSRASVMRIFGISGFVGAAVSLFAGAVIFLHATLLAARNAYAILLWGILYSVFGFLHVFAYRPRFPKTLDGDWLD